ncbi:hypothetical protein PAXRUDRAFT_22895 [Paxillus rubicundulus Ve08.2h10]|uniref:Uncharacterized protein n=1 Tax=Paxillus rubicundulus Ve08.2h10 TaxID=930991 RepID=A0A0D0BJC3_9AGAM|nr:hypothetical protein PAXRUDRAFT_22895 [Paxillus rubicundulus Ve08.2h10]
MYTIVLTSSQAVWVELQAPRATSVRTCEIKRELNSLFAAMGIVAISLEYLHKLSEDRHRIERYMCFELNGIKVADRASGRNAEHNHNRA